MKKTGIILAILMILGQAAFLSQAAQVSASAAAAAPDPSKPNRVFLPLASRQYPEFFVSPSGSDANPGYINKPWRTIAKAASMVHPGDTVYIRGGVYNEAVNIRVSGTAAEPIKISAYPGESPIIEGNNTLPADYAGLVSVKGSWVRVSGLEVRNSKYVGLALYGEHNTASSNFVHHSQKAGIYASGDYSLVENNRVWRNSMSNENFKGNSWSSGLASARDSKDGLTEYAILRKNVVWENWGQGIDTYESNGTIMEDNVSYDNAITNIYISDSTNVLCQRNFVFRTTSSIFGSTVGIMIGDERYTPPSANIKVINNIGYGNDINFALWKGAQGGQIKNVLIANNTFVNSVDQAGVVLRGYHQGVRFENNIVEQEGTLDVISIDRRYPIDVTFSTNLWSKSPPDYVRDPSGKVDNPKLSASGGNPYVPDWYKLTSNSWAINRAFPLAEVSLDYFRIARDGSPDVGASEYTP